MMKTFTHLFLALVVATAAGCATIVSKTNYPVTIATDPAGAEVSIVNHKGKEVFKGQSPAATRLYTSGGYFRGANYTVTISKPGYSDKKLMVTTKVNGWYFGNLLFGGAIGFLIVDPATGAMFKLQNTRISEILTEKTAGLQEPSLHIYALENIPESWRPHLVKIK
jgi:hypothetical protein